MPDDPSLARLQRPLNMQLSTKNRFCTQSPFGGSEITFAEGATLNNKGEMAPQALKAGMVAIASNDRKLFLCRVSAAPKLEPSTDIWLTDRAPVRRL
jgi:hypothetical protein